MNKDREILQAIGFEGFKSMGELMAGKKKEIPAEKGVYVVLRECDYEPKFLEEGTGGFYKSKNPNVSVSELRSNWVPNTSIVYIGKAGGSKSSATLKTRLAQYLRFGQGANVGHWGGRYIWQLQDSRNLIVCWRKLYSEEPREIEQQMIDDFKVLHGGKFPFANLTD